MAKLSDFAVDADAIKDGEWVRLGGDYDDIEIHTRGLTDQYWDTTSAKQRKMAQGFNGDTEALPVRHRRDINTRAFIEHCLLDPPVKNLFHDDARTKEVTGEEFRKMLLDPRYQKLVAACYAAARRVGQNIDSDMDAAAKN